MKAHETFHSLLLHAGVLRNKSPVRDGHFSFPPRPARDSSSPVPANWLTAHLAGRHRLRPEVIVAATRPLRATLSPAHRASASSSRKLSDVALRGTDDAFSEHTKGLCTRMTNLRFNLFWQNVFCSVIPFHSFDFSFFFLQLPSHISLG